MKSFIVFVVFYDGWFEYVKSWEDSIKENPDQNIIRITFEDAKKVILITQSAF